MIDKLFLEHPRSVGESYGRHMRQALSFAGHLALAAMACLVHAVLPALFRTSASRRISVLYDRMLRHRRHVRNPVSGDGGTYVPDYVI